MNLTGGALHLDRVNLVNATKINAAARRRLVLW